MQTEIGSPLAVLGVCKQNKKKLKKKPKKKLTQSREDAEVNQENWWGEACRAVGLAEAGSRITQRVRKADRRRSKFEPGSQNRVRGTGCPVNSFSNSGARLRQAYGATGPRPTIPVLTFAPLREIFPGLILLLNCAPLPPAKTLCL
jgi:hypothetical protein